MDELISLELTKREIELLSESVIIVSKAKGVDHATMKELLDLHTKINQEEK